MGQNLPSVPPKKFSCSEFFEIFRKCCTRNELIILIRLSVSETLI